MLSLMGKETTDVDQTAIWSLRRWRNRHKNPDPARVLEKLSKALEKKLKRSLKTILNLTEGFDSILAFQLSLDLLCNARLEIEKALKRRDLITGDVAIALLDDEIAKIQRLIKSGQFTHSPRALQNAISQASQLFCAKQHIKNQCAIVTRPALIETQTPVEPGSVTPKQLPLSTGDTGRRMIIHSSVLVQLNQSLFPAERMIVAAGISAGGDIAVGGIYDVTGEASQAGVKADANLLGRALIAMETTETYFALWIHSHPGQGKNATHPSSIDLNQEEDWLKDYSPNLVNAIMVRDRFIRFWGKSIETKRVTIEVVGSGVQKIEPNIYKLN